MGGQNFSFPTLFDSYRELLLRPKNLAGELCVFDKSMKLSTNDWQQLLNNSGYRGIGNNSSNKNKLVLTKNSDVSIFRLIWWV